MDVKYLLTNIFHLITDFFDDPPNGMAKKNDSAAADKKISEVLPEGFFDDPIMDAKVRRTIHRIFVCFLAGRVMFDSISEI